jgi:hypothetical protein
MRKGGGKEKGSAFERAIGAALSLWITAGERKDLFSRNVLSGGRFTNALKNDDKLGIPGDLMAAHPLAFDFLAGHVIECKHYKDLNLDAFLFDQQRKSFLIQVFDHTKAQGQAIGGLWPLIIAKQNMRPTILLCESQIGELLLAAIPQRTRRAPTLWHHKLQRGRLYMFLLDDVLQQVPASRYIASVLSFNKAA